jgi:hypothetical protein
MRRDNEMKPLIWGEDKMEYFCCDDWTAKIRLKWLEKLVFTRRGLMGDFRADGQGDKRAMCTTGNDARRFNRVKRLVLYAALAPAAQYEEPIMGLPTSRWLLRHTALFTQRDRASRVDRS